MNNDALNDCLLVWLALLSAVILATFLLLAQSDDSCNFLINLFYAVALKSSCLNF